MKRLEPSAARWPATASPPSPRLRHPGHLPHGYGVKAEGMGGASIAPQDAVAGANNLPAWCMSAAVSTSAAPSPKVDNGAWFGGTRHDGAEDKSLYIIPSSATTACSTAPSPSAFRWSATAWAPIRAATSAR